MSKDQIHPVNVTQFEIACLELMLKCSDYPDSDKLYSRQFVQWFLCQPQCKRDWKTRKKELTSQFQTLESLGLSTLLSRLFSGELLYPDHQPLKLRRDDIPHEAAEVLLVNYIESINDKA